MQITAFDRCNKETEEIIAAIDQSFLKQPIGYVEQNPIEYIYVEAKEFASRKIDAVVIEFDDMFKVKTALFGLTLQKKYSNPIKTYLRSHLTPMLGSSSAMFNGQEGLWEINIAFDAMESFEGSETMGEALEKLLAFVDDLLKEINAA